MIPRCLLTLAAVVSLQAQATLQIKVSLRTGQEAAIEMPEAFQRHESAPATRADEPWSNDFVDTEGLRVRVEHPRTWAVRPSADAMLLTLENRAGGAARFMTVARARTAQMQSLEPATATAVQQLATAFRQMVIGGPGGNPLKSGQARVGGRLWFWLEISAPAGNLPELRPEIKDALTAEFDVARAWTFSTITNGRLLLVDFILLSPSAAAPDDRIVTDAGQEFAALLQRVAIEPRP